MRGSNTGPAAPQRDPGRRGILRHLAQASLVYASALFAMRALAFLLLPLYTRFLTPSDYGKISLAETTAAVIGVACSLGLDNSMRRLYFEYVGDPAALACYVSTVVRSAVATTALVIGFFLLGGQFLFSTFAPHFPVPFYPYTALALSNAAVVPLISYRLVLYQTESRPKSYAYLALLGFMLTSCATVLLVVVMHRGAIGMLLGKFIASAVGSTAGIILLRNWLRAGWRWRYLRESLHLGFPLVLYQLTLLGLEVADRFILQHYRSIAEVGLYSVAYTFGLVMWVITYALWQAWAPLFYDLARDLDGNRRVLGNVFSGLIVLLTSIAIFGIAIAQDVIRFVFDARYQPAARVIPVIIAGYVLYGVFFFLQLAALQEKKTGGLSLITLGAFMANIALNVLLVPRAGMYGSAYATLIAFAVAALLMYLYSLRVYPLPLNPMYILWAVAAVAAMLTLTQLPLYPLMRTLALATGILIAYAALWFLAGPSLREAASSIREQRRFPSHS